MIAPRWEVRSLGDLVDVLDHKRVPVSAKERASRLGGIPYYGATGQVGWIDKPLFNEPLLLLGEDGVQFFDHDRSKAYLIEGPSWVNNHAHVLRPRANITDRRFLKYYLNWADYRNYVNGTTRLKLTKSAMMRIQVLLPALDEQRAIVEILEDHLSRVGAAESYLRSVVAKGDVARGAVLQAMLQSDSGPESGDVSVLHAERVRRCSQGMRRGRPDPAPPCAADVPWEGRWPTVSLEQATDPVRTISYGILKPGPNLSVGVPYVRVLNMRGDQLSTADLHSTSPEIAAQYARTTLEPGDVLVSIRGTYGRVVLVPEELRGANITQDTARLALLPQLLPEFVAHVIRSPWAQRHLKRVARGVAVKGVNIKDLRELPIPLPTLDQQHRLVAHAAALTSDVEMATRTARVGLLRAKALRRSLLDAAFSGRLGQRTMLQEAP